MAAWNRPGKRSLSGSEPLTWLAALLLVFGFLACLALAVTAGGPGLGSEGQKIHFRFAGAVNKTPHCPPSMPCPVIALADRDHLTLWFMRETQIPAGVQTNYWKLLDLPLW